MHLCRSSVTNLLSHCPLLQLLLIAVVLAFMGARTGSAQSLSSAEEKVLETAQSLEPTVRNLSMEVWEDAETALKEKESSEVLASRLEEAGFTVERGVADMPTAFVASYGSGSPVIGVLAEFDALGGVGNEPVPYKKPREDGTMSGHGCGHNVFGAASTSGAIALKRAMEEMDFSGTVRLYGSPAEETLVGKTYMAREGLFDDLDAAIEWHPGTDTETDNNAGRAMNNFRIEFFGESAHGASDPWNGRSALDAVELLSHGVNMMREHIKPSHRIHYMIENGGEAPNVVPNNAKVWYFARDYNREQVNHYYSWIKDIAKGAAQATRTDYEVNLISGVHATLLNRPLQEAMYANMKQIGPPEFTEEEQEYARTLQENTGKEQDGYSTEVEELADEPEDPSGGSTDVAEVSRIAPTVGFSVATAPQNIPWHSWAVTSAHGRETAVKGGVVATKIIALMGYDMFTDEELLEKAQEEFEEKKDGPYESPLPPNQEPPVPAEVREVMSATSSGGG
jgi:aminobenzoyl-glutamate utilization protein B